MATTEDAEPIDLPVALDRTASIVDEIQALGVEVGYVGDIHVGSNSRSARVELVVNIPADAAVGDAGDQPVDQSDGGLSKGDAEAADQPEPRDVDFDTTESAVRERRDDAVESAEALGLAPEGRPLPAGEDLDHTDIEHLEWAYGAYDSVADAAEEFSVSYSAVYNRLRKHGIHGTGDEDESSDDQDDDVDEASSPTPEPRSVDWDDLEPAVTDHDGPLLEEEEHADAEDSEEKAWPYQKLDESSLPARIGLVEVLDAVEQEGPGAWTSYVAAELGVSDEEARDALWLLELREPNGSKLLPDPELSEQIAEIREEVDQ